MNRYEAWLQGHCFLADMRGSNRNCGMYLMANTGSERKNSRPVQLWKMNAEHEQPIIRALDAAFDVPAGAGSLENHIMKRRRHLRDARRKTAGRLVAYRC